MTAAQLAASGLDVNTGALERVMRACASVGLFTEDAESRFGPTPLSEVLTASAPGSVKMVAQEAGGTWLRILGDSRRRLRTPGHRTTGKISRSPRDSCRSAGVNPGGQGEKPRLRCGVASTRICGQNIFE